MSNALSYNRKTTGEDFVTLPHQYTADEIEMISDPNGGLSQKPRTAIPSPFAQMDLVKNAFSRLSANPRLQGDVMDERLVSYALDVAQLFFNYGELSGKLTIVEWDRQRETELLKRTPAHRLLGETLEMFMEQDKEAFNFGRMDKLFFLMCGDKVLGGTSPVSLFMASPDAAEGMADISVEQNIRLFGLWRPLHMRQPGFVKYIYSLFTAYPELKLLCQGVNEYLRTNLAMLPTNLKEEILSEIGNPGAMDIDGSGKAAAYMEANYERLTGGVQILGVPLYCAKEEDVVEAIAASDFVIQPSIPQEDRLPLVLQNRLNAPRTDPFRYVTANWDDNTVITPADWAAPVEKRVLPATSHAYPWLTTDDFLHDSIIKLDYAVDGDCFFNGNLAAVSNDTDCNDFLPPIKPLFFKYFNAEDLRSTVGGMPMFCMEHSHSGQAETLKATLRIPVKKAGKHITLQKTYTYASEGSTQQPGFGRIVPVQFALSIFPFVKIPGRNTYNVQLIDRAIGSMENCRLGLQFHQNASPYTPLETGQRERSLKGEKRVGSQYYRVEDSFDYIRVSVEDGRGNHMAHGVASPLWPTYAPGHDAFTFAVDFGTTNTHVEHMRQGGLPEPLSISSAGRARLTATLYNGRHILYDVIMKQELLPKEIGGTYGFPQRTVLSECERVDVENTDEVVPLGDANIPFIYEKESVGYGNRIVPNLKWSTDISNSKRVRAYLSELAMLMRAKVLVENGDLGKTRLVWSYPLSMKAGNVGKLAEAWEKTFRKVFGVEPCADNLIQLPESVAPYYFYKAGSSFRGAASTVASIDIGGGTSDVVVFESNAKQPTLISSFRFAANTIFGDGFSEIPQGDTNPLVSRYADYFHRLFEADDDKYGELIGILDDITAKRSSEDINAFLFSVAGNEAVAGNDVFSYNLRLNEDQTMKIVFIYFYCAIAYYVAFMMKSRSIAKPRSVMFSGMGSKILDIVGRQRDLDLLTREIFERVYGEVYGEDGFSVVMERREPKQITCRGALMEVRDGQGCRNVEELNRLMDAFENPLKFNYSMLSAHQLTYSDMEDADTRKAIVERVKEFNSFFLRLCEDMKVEDRYLVSPAAMDKFRELVGKDLEHHLIGGWNFVNKNAEKLGSREVIEDTVFFYPIAGSIRNNLIQNLY